MSFFRIGKQGNRDCLLDSRGSPFFSLGIVHVGAYPEGEGQTLFEVQLLNTKDRKKYELLFSDRGKLIEKKTIKDEEN